MQMEEAHTCSSAVIAGRLGLLRNQDADNRFPHKTRRVEPTNLQVPLRKHSGIIVSTIWLPLISILPEKSSQVHKSKLPERKATPFISDALCSPGHFREEEALMSHITKKVRYSSKHSETERRSCLSRNQTTNPHVQHAIQLACPDIQKMLGHACQGNLPIEIITPNMNYHSFPISQLLYVCCPQRN